MKCKIEHVNPIVRQKFLIRNIALNVHTPTVKVKRACLRVLSLHRGKTAKKQKIFQGQMVGVGPLEYCGNGIQVKRTSRKTVW